MRPFAFDTPSEFLLHIVRLTGKSPVPSVKRGPRPSTGSGNEPGVPFDYAEQVNAR
jgi:hypothetical protein